MAQLTANYETVMVLSMKNGEEGVNTLVEKFNTLIADNAEITKVDTWGQRALAYPMNDETVEFSREIRFGCEVDHHIVADRFIVP